eukprot:gene1331-1674_t
MASKSSAVMSESESGTSSGEVEVPDEAAATSASGSLPPHHHHSGLQLKLPSATSSASTSSSESVPVELLQSDSSMLQQAAAAAMRTTQTLALVQGEISSQPQKACWQVAFKDWQAPLPAKTDEAAIKRLTAVHASASVSAQQACLDVVEIVGKGAVQYMYNLCCELKAPAGEACVYKVLSENLETKLKPEHCLMLWGVYQLVVQDGQPPDLINRLLPNKRKIKSWTRSGLRHLVALAQSYVQKVLPKVELGGARWDNVNIVLDQSVRRCLIAQAKHEASG